MKRLIVASAISVLFSAPATVVAQTPSPPADTPAESGFDVSGYADVSFNHLSRSALFTSGAPSRVFDIERNGAAIRQLALTVAKQPKEGLGGLVNLIVGKDADVIAAYNTKPSDGTGCNVVTGLNATGGSCTRDRFDVTQAFLQYATGAWTIVGGKFVTSAGAEVINSTSNTNFSRSILFGYAIPFTHTGGRVSYSASDTLTLMAGINQGWDDVKDTNSAKTLELSGTFTPTKTVSVVAALHSGRERVGGLVNTGPEGQRNLIDLVATINATDKLTFILNYDHGSQANTATVTPLGAGTSTWDGWAGYANYQFTDQWRLSFRAETFNDANGYRTGVVQKWKEATLALAYLPTKAIEVRAEVRGDRSNVASFRDRDGVTGRNNQNSYGVQFLYKF